MIEINIKAKPTTPIQIKPIDKPVKQTLAEAEMMLAYYQNGGDLEYYETPKGWVNYPGMWRTVPHTVRVHLDNYCFRKKNV